MSNGKFTASVENKTLRQYSIQEEAQGTAPVDPLVKPETPVKTETANTVVTAPPADKGQMAIPATIISPLDEMNRQPVEKPVDTVKEKPAKKGKKPFKVAKNKDQ